MNSEYTANIEQIRQPLVDFSIYLKNMEETITELELIDTGGYKVIYVNNSSTSVVFTKSNELYWYRNLSDIIKEFVDTYIRYNKLIFEVEYIVDIKCVSIVISEGNDIVKYSHIVPVMIKKPLENSIKMLEYKNVVQNAFNFNTDVVGRKLKLCEPIDNSVMFIRELTNKLRHNSDKGMYKINIGAGGMFVMVDGFKNPILVPKQMFNYIEINKLVSDIDKICENNFYVDVCHNEYLKDVVILMLRSEGVDYTHLIKM